jgi:hypothetical protein
METKFIYFLTKELNKSTIINNLYYQIILVYFLYTQFINNTNIDDIYNYYLDFLKEIEIKNKICNINYNINLTQDDIDKLYYTFINDKDLINQIKEKYIIDIIYNYYNDDKKLKQYTKEFDLFHIDMKTTKIINNIILNNNYENVCNIFSNTGNLIFNIYNNLSVFDLYGLDPKINMICYYNFLIYNNNKINNININTSDILTDNKINMKYDLILGEIPNNIKNLIYTNCNSKIKSLKIRGTKSEPMVFQFISQILNKNGKAVIITTNSFLFGDSNQHILTRKYLLENFNIKIIDLNNKKSIIILDKTNLINEILFEISENNEIITIPNNEIINKNYSFYYYNYLKIDNKNNEPSIKVEDIVDIYDNKYKNYKQNQDYIYSFKYNQFNIDKPINNHEYIFVTKNNDLYKQDFINIYLKDIFEKNIKKIVKGKMNQLDIDIIKNIDIIIPSQEIQSNIIDYKNNCKKLKIINDHQINILNNIKNNIIKKHIDNFDKQELSKICNITHATKNKNTIYIHKNTSMAGCIDLTNCNNEDNTNKYFINDIDKQYNQDYLYNILLYYQNYFIKCANNNNTICLAKKFIESCMIPKNELDSQINLNNNINKININIQNYEKLLEEPYTSVF